MNKITIDRAVVEQVLEAWDGDEIEWFKRSYTVMENLRAALAEPVQEPAFHGFMSDDGTQVDVCFSPSAPRRDGTYATAYYTAPPHRVAPQQAEPVQEPAYKVKVAGRWHEAEPLAAAFNLPDGEHLLYATPPQRLSTQNELDDAMRTPRAMAQAYEAGWRAALAQLQQVGWMQKSTGVIRCDWGFDTTGYVPVYAAQEKE